MPAGYKFYAPPTFTILFYDPTFFSPPTSGHILLSWCHINCYYCGVILIAPKQVSIKKFPMQLLLRYYHYSMGEKWGKITQLRTLYNIQWEN
jgi:hypothetical protein